LTDQTRENVQKKLNDGKLMEASSKYEDVFNFDVGVIQKFGMI
jgi:hypothetical protein